MKNNTKKPAEPIVSSYWAGKVRIDGKGGKEKLLAKVFPKSQRYNAPLFDLIDCKGDPRELKKQANVQWFDAGKYHLLNDNETSILMTFIMHKKGKIQKIFDIRLGRMLELLYSNKKYRSWGWTKNNVRTCYQQKRKFPTQQAKIQVKVQEFFEENEKELRVLWERQ